MKRHNKSNFKSRNLLPRKNYRCDEKYLIWVCNLKQRLKNNNNRGRTKSRVRQISNDLNRMGVIFFRSRKKLIALDSNIFETLIVMHDNSLFSTLRTDYYFTLFFDFYVESKLFVSHCSLLRAEALLVVFIWFLLLFSLHRTTKDNMIQSNRKDD